MEQKNGRSPRLWRYLLPAEAVLLLALAALRFTHVLPFRITTLTLTALLFLAFDALLLFWRYDKAHRTEPVYRNRRVVLLVLLLITLLASAPLFTDYLLKGHDIQFHLFRIEGVRDGLADGQFPVRIHPNTLYGNGYANPAFYPELLLYFPAVLRLCGFSVMGAYKVFLFTLNLMTAVFCYYACVRIFRSAKLGLLGSAFYTLSLYRLVNLYTRAAIGEASAMAFLPLVAVGIYAILFDDTAKPAYRRAFLPLAAGMTGLISTHLLSCEMALPLLAVFCLLYWRRTCSAKRFLSLLAAAGTTLLLSLAFLIPMLDYMGYDHYNVFLYSTANLAKEAINPAQLFPLFPNAIGESNAGSFGAAGEMPLGVGLIGLALLMLYPALCAACKQNAADPCEKRARPILFCYVAAIVLLVLSTNLFPWDALYRAGGIVASVAGLIQFPWRLLSLVTVLFTFVFCQCFALLPKLTNAPMRRAVAFALCLLMLLTTASYTDHLIQQSDALFIYANTDLDQTRSVGDAEYLPLGAKGADFYREDAPGNVGKDLSIADFMRDGTKISFTVTNSGSDAQSLDLPLIHYLGYYAIGADGAALPLSKGEGARIQVSIPAGYDGTVQVRFAERPLWRAVEAVTLLSFCAVLYWIISERRRFGAGVYADYTTPIAVLE